MAQQQWDARVAATAGYLAGGDIRPRIFDQTTGTWLLLDSGAAVSVFPKTKCKKPPPEDQSRHLQAVNGSRIRTFGNRTVDFNFGRKYPHNVIIADIKEAILGWDFLSKYHLDLVWSKGGTLCHLADKSAKKKFNLKLQPSPTHNNLAVVNSSFKAWSQQIKIESAKTEPATKIPHPYQAIIDDHPTILTVDFKIQPKHGVVHDIDTGENKPCRAKPRPLLPNSPKFLAGKQSWLELQKLGIVEKVKPGEPTT